MSQSVYDDKWGKGDKNGDGYKISLSFYRSQVEAAEGNIEAACIGSASHGQVTCGGIKYFGNVDGETDGQVWSQNVSYEDFTASGNQFGLETNQWFNMGSAEMPNTSGQDFSVARYQGINRQNNKEEFYNQGWRIDTECEDCEAWYYQFITDGNKGEEVVTSLGSFVFTGAVELTVAASVSIAAVLAF